MASLSTIIRYVGYELEHAIRMAGTDPVLLALARKENALLCHAINSHDVGACREEECDWCAMILCPFAFELHLHHDGCGACYYAGLQESITRAEGDYV